MLEMLACSGASAYGAFTMWRINHFMSEEDRIIISGVRPENDCVLLTGCVYERVLIYKNGTYIYLFNVTLVVRAAIKATRSNMETLRGRKHHYKRCLSFYIRVKQ